MALSDNGHSTWRDETCVIQGTLVTFFWAIVALDRNF